MAFKKLVAAFGCLVLAQGIASCGGSEKCKDDEEKKDGKCEKKEGAVSTDGGQTVSQITLDPPAGTYTYKPWVVMKQAGDALGILYTKAPGQADFQSATLDCIQSPYKDTSADTKLGECVEITQTGQLAYYMKLGDDKSSDQTADYVVTLETNNVSVTMGKDKEKVDFSEVETFCHFDSDDTLEVVVQTKQEAKLGADRFAYVQFEIKDPKAGAEAKYTQENDKEVGLEIKPTSDDIPEYLGFGTITYSSKPGDDGKLDDVTYPPSSCVVKIATFERGKDIKGTVQCDALRSWKSSSEAADELLGKSIDLSSKWSCDRYR